MQTEERKQEKMGNKDSRKSKEEINQNGTEEIKIRRKTKKK